MTLIHILILLTTGYSIARADLLGAAWMRGTTPTLDKAHVGQLHMYVWYGLVGMIVTGGIMFSQHVGELLSTPTFFVKMAFVATLIVNSFFIEKFADIATERTFASLTKRERFSLFLSGGISVFAWLGAIAMALTLD